MPVWPSPAWQPIYDAFKNLRATWPARGWSWDSRLGCVTSSFSTEFEAKARSAAVAALPFEWTSTSLASAPSNLRGVAERAGGIRAGQALLARGAANGPQAFGLWWPWGDGQTISLRVGLVDTHDGAEAYTRIREIFNVSL